jgi:hypothetical protein
MKTVEEITGMDAETKVKLQEVLDKVSKGIPFTPEEKDAALARMDRMREANRQRFGETNIAVELVRQGRDNP